MVRHGKFVYGALLSVTVIAYGQRLPYQTSDIRDVVQSTLIAPGSTPFHLKATITRGQEHSPYATVEMSWLSPDKYCRVIEADDFTQTIIVNGDQVSEQDSSDYFPLQLHTLVTAMVDTRPILKAVRPGDRLLTKANGAVNASGITCYGPDLCFKDPYGLRETVGASGHSVAFTQYQKFKGKWVARMLTNAPRLGEEVITLTVDELDELHSPDPTPFKTDHQTSPSQQLRIATLKETELRSHVLGPQQIIWPQTLDGEQKGSASFYVSIDRAGNVREVQQLYTVNERTNDSAINQIMKWKFDPFTKAGLPAQAEGILTFILNTRAWGPSAPLTDAEARKLASNIVEPDVPIGKYPPGTTYSLRVAVDSQGKVIEVIAGDDGPSDLFIPCYEALKKWSFSPIMEGDLPRPYRAHIEFHFH